MMHDAGVGNVVHLHSTVGTYMSVQTLLSSPRCLLKYDVNEAYP